MESSIKKVVFIILLAREVFSAYELKNVNYTITCNPNYFNLTIVHTDKESHVGFLKYELFRDLPNLHIKLLLKLMKSDFLLIDYILNACYIDKFRRRNGFVRQWMDGFIQRANFKFKCPFKKGSYQLNEAENIDTSGMIQSIPGIMRVNETIYYELSLLLKARNQMIELTKDVEFWSLEFRPE